MPLQNCRAGEHRTQGTPASLLAGAEDWKIKGLLSKSLFPNENLKAETSGMNHLPFKIPWGCSRFCVWVKDKDEINEAATSSLWGK